MPKPVLVNLGCGSHYHHDWLNFDFVSDSTHVTKCNLLEGVPLEANIADVVYHSHVLEHFPRNKAHKFIDECFRLLKPGGVVRIAIPDLHGIVGEYLRIVDELAVRPDNKELSADYDWITLEMYDQTVRNFSGGAMGEYLTSGQVSNRDFVMKRCGEEVRPYLERSIQASGIPYRRPPRWRRILTALRQGHAKELIVRWLLGKEYSYLQIGRFRSGGEIHQWMYDSYSLGRMLTNAGFIDIKVRSAFDSSIPDWTSYNLDGKDGKVRKPDSLFVEARKAP